MPLPVEAAGEPCAALQCSTSQADGQEVARAHAALVMAVRVVAPVAEVQVGGHLERQPRAGVRLAGYDVESQVDEVLLVVDFVVAVGLGGVGGSVDVDKRSAVVGESADVGIWIDHNGSNGGVAADSKRIVADVLTIDGVLDRAAFAHRAAVSEGDSAVVVGRRVDNYGVAADGDVRTKVENAFVAADVHRDGIAARGRDVEVVGDGCRSCPFCHRCSIHYEDAVVGHPDGGLGHTFEGILADAGHRAGEGDGLRVCLKHLFGGDGRQLGAVGHVEVGVNTLESIGADAGELAALGEGDGAGGSPVAKRT